MSSLIERPAMDLKSLEAFLTYFAAYARDLSYSPAKGILPTGDALLEMLLRLADPELRPLQLIQNIHRHRLDIDYLFRNAGIKLDIRPKRKQPSLHLSLTYLDPSKEGQWFAEIGVPEGSEAVIFELFPPDYQEWFKRLSQSITLEHERAIKQRDTFLATGQVTAAQGGSHDTCFDHLMRIYLKELGINV